jgi:hypothetical protein
MGLGRRLLGTLLVGLAVAGTLTGTAAASARRVALPGGRRLFLECRGSGSPAVVLEAGFRNDADVWTQLAAPGQTVTVFGKLVRSTRVCAYDRPGTVSADGSGRSRSDPVRMPRTTGALVADLAALLRAARLKPPYVGRPLDRWSHREAVHEHPSTPRRRARARGRHPRDDGDASPSRAGTPTTPTTSPRRPRRSRTTPTSSTSTSRRASRRCVAWGSGRRAAFR